MVSTLMRLCTMQSIHSQCHYNPILTSQDSRGECARVTQHQLLSGQNKNLIKTHPLSLPVSTRHCFLSTVFFLTCPRGRGSIFFSCWLVTLCGGRHSDSAKKISGSDSSQNCTISTWSGVNARTLCARSLCNS